MFANRIRLAGLLTAGALGLLILASCGDESRESNLVDSPVAPLRAQHVDWLVTGPVHIENLNVCKYWTDGTTGVDTDFEVFVRDYVTATDSTVTRTLTDGECRRWAQFDGANPGDVSVTELVPVGAVLDSIVVTIVDNTGAVTSTTTLTGTDTFSYVGADNSVGIQVEFFNRMEPVVPEEPIRVTGGGVDTDGEIDLRKLAKGPATEENRYQFGGQAGAPTASQPQPWGNWTHHQQRGPDGSFVFHAGTPSAPAGTEIDLIVGADPGHCNPARLAPMKQIDFEGIGTFKNIRHPSAALSGVVAGVTHHWFEVHIEDLGEPGRSGHQDPPAGTCPPGGSDGLVANCDCPDYYRITIYAEFPAGGTPNKTTAIYEVEGYVAGGNLQIHPAIN